MEVEFDREMDALLRKAASLGVFAGEVSQSHLDADAIAAFAENAVPQKSREIYTRHLAECDPCRKTLSNLIVLNAETAPEMAAVAAPVAAASVPWYRSLFATRNLAYTMGALVLVFGGMLGVLVLQNSYSDNATVSQVQEPQQPFAAPARSETSNESALAANSSANSNAVSNAAGEIPRSIGTAETADEVSTTSPPPPIAVESAPAPTKESLLAGADKPVTTTAPKDAARTEVDQLAAAKNEEKARVTEQESRKMVDDNVTLREQQKQVQNQTQLQMMPGANSSGPNRADIQRDNRAYERPAPKAKKSDEDVSGSGTGRASGTRTAGGKKFEQRNGVWYDTSYRGQGTKNVRRGTDDYRKLDSGLRSIADGIGGTVVVVWNGKAYRIQ